MRKRPHRPTDFFGPRVREVRDRPTDLPGLPESVVGRLHNAGRAQTKVGPILIENGVKMRRFALSEAPVVLGGSKRTDEGSGVPWKAAVMTVTDVTDRYACARSAGPTDRPLEVRSAQSAGPTDRPWTPTAKLGSATR